MASKLVYSTSSGGRQQADAKKAGGYRTAAGPTKMRLETKGRGGKAVTVLFNLPFAEDEARRIMKELQSALGCGATLKDSTIEFQGDRRERIEAYYATHGLRIVRAGG